MTMVAKSGKAGTVIGKSYDVNPEVKADYAYLVIDDHGLMLSIVPAVHQSMPHCAINIACGGSWPRRPGVT